MNEAQAASKIKKIQRAAKNVRAGNIIVSYRTRLWPSSGVEVWKVVTKPARVNVAYKHMRNWTQPTHPNLNDVVWLSKQVFRDAKGFKLRIVRATCPSIPKVQYEFANGRKISKEKLISRHICTEEELEPLGYAPLIQSIKLENVLMLNGRKI